MLASALALFAVGAVISVLTYRPTLWAGLRQLAIGAVAAGATFGLGSLVGAGLG